ncbi:SDR family NAD(P)-dependent oxidoreductase [Algimonas porphyrae]|uniref:Short-chain dehydrogenase n=1 Tax=Algimonas porphyrae TaxID=1128113 RepID=A0ABQ5V1Y8_9PROT|nr:SDR family NAD(P)-dependent oxidoreductase [Algimonas porphyrae]GLQ21573.1 short-chain dehydrogenase [Algimonas porphyrae]
MTTRTALIIGAGADTGSAIARAFAKEGYHVCVTRRPRNMQQLGVLAGAIRAFGGAATPFGVDARNDTDMAALVEQIESTIGPIEVCVFNIGANVRFEIGDTTPRVFKKVWEMACYAGFLTAHNVLPRMAGRGRGTFIFTGATASLRGGAGFGAFASAKAGLRNLAQSAAREYGPRNVHVAHVVVDGMIDSRFIRENVPSVDSLRARDRILNPDHIAQNYVHLHRQHRDAWTFELDLRPYGETW